MMKKALAAVISAAVIAFGCIAPAFTSTAATLTAENDAAYPGMDENGDLQISGINTFTPASTDLWGLIMGSSATYESIAADNLAKTITFKNFVTGNAPFGGDQSELYIAQGSNGYTYIFDGVCSVMNLCIEDGLDITINLSLTPGSTLTTGTWYNGINNRITLLPGTTADPATLPNLTAITFSGAAAEDEEDADAEEADADGEEEFILTPEMIEEILRYFNELEYLDRLHGFENDLLQAAYSATPASPQVLYYSEGNALPLEVFGILKTNPNVSIVFHYTYKGQTYQLWISGAQAAKYYNENIKWYGPELLASMFPADTSGMFDF